MENETKEALDKECLEVKHKGKCRIRDANEKFYKTGCGVCPKNLHLVEAITRATEGLK